MREVASVTELQALVGRELGVSDWVTVDQERIDKFADATDDHQWIHVDVERAKRESPMGGPIAHGFLTLSLLPMLNSNVFRVDGVKARINYGLNRVRFPAPVPAGARVRSRLHLKAVEDLGSGRYLACVECTVEIEGNDRPACIAESLGMYII
ncbi:dehydratase [Alkalilimnicola ehrlichii]|uniref:Dehydratase n=1 Tax=Alkalilimnicola ehrlichii TaxID=351052 RepID=A0A3E0WNI8_9GAMM|nr:MaoC family dehydratase [Alkalilimnicola ehrlichii]RFA27257.1 dehydratase [Alkalilimnicola ehrlichii]RFA34368.1 dehydratase [Alkalilimnicola ehrlichii]